MKNIVYALTTLLLVFLMGAAACNQEPPETVSQQSSLETGDLVPQEIHYINPNAGEVLLAWGVDGWQALPETLFPDGTFMQNNVMHTPMQPEDGRFVVTIAIPGEAVLDYGFFVVTDGSGRTVDLWDGDYQLTAVAGAITENVAQVLLGAGSATAGKELFLTTCAQCHGLQAQGMPGLGLNLVSSQFVQTTNDDELVAFIQAGRAIDDPQNSTGVAMPPNGGNPALSPEKLQDIVAYLRALAAPNAEELLGQVQTGVNPVVAEGFSISLFNSLTEKYLTSLEFGPDGTLYVCSYDGIVWAVVDADGDGLGEDAQIFAEGFVKPVGLAWGEQELFVASQGKITALQDQDGDGKADSQREVVSGLPAGIYPIHANNDMAFGPDGRLYFGVGATSDISVETIPFAASILSINPDGTDLQQVATGTRNSYDVAFNQAGDLFTTDNGPDDAGEEQIFPPDELNQIVTGGDYGFPLYFGRPTVDSGTLGPVLLFPVHSAPAGIVFYHGETFPAEFVDNAFVALWTEGQIYRVLLSKLADGTYLANGFVFASGLPGIVDVAVGPDGSLYASLSESGDIYRISYGEP